MIVLEPCKRCKVSIVFVHDRRDRRVPIDARSARCGYRRCGHNLGAHAVEGGPCRSTDCPCAFFVKPYQLDRRLHTDHRKVCAGRRQPHHQHRGAR